MNDTKQPEALRLAAVLIDYYFGAEAFLAGKELRRLHARNTELEAQLEAIGAGGVEPLLKTAPAVVEAPANPTVYMDEATYHAMQSTPISHKTRWPVYCMSEWSDKSGYVALSALQATPPAQAQEDATQQVEVLRDLINRRPAHNAGIDLLYARWNAECYRVMGAQAKESVNNSKAQEDARDGARAAQGGAI